MKSIKKRFKLLLADIKQSANELAVLSADLPLLADIQQITDKVLLACATLEQQASELKKAEFIGGIADSEALAELDEIADTDTISSLEEHLFAELNNHADSAVGEFLQQMLDKLESRHARLLGNIQQLCALLDEE